jgi:RNA polymerase sigma-70 factor, ECF subfamily
MPDHPDQADNWTGPDWNAAERTLIETYQSLAQSPEQLFAQVYNELRQVAHAYMRRERADHSLGGTALVHEAYMRLFDGQVPQWENRKHLFCTVARCMRRVLVDHARRHNAERHGGLLRKVSLDEHGPAICQNLPQLIALSAALDRLAELEPRQARVVDLHAFAGLTEAEIAEVLGVALKTVKNDWRFAKAWLKTEMGVEPDDPGAPRADSANL